MDPNAALAGMRKAYAEGRYEDCAGMASALDQWISSGGFLPSAWSSAYEET